MVKSSLSDCAKVTSERSASGRHWRRASRALCGWVGVFVVVGTGGGEEESVCVFVFGGMWANGWREGIRLVHTFIHPHDRSQAASHHGFNRLNHSRHHYQSRSQPFE